MLRKLVLVLVAAGVLSAGVVRIEVASRADVLGGEEFGSAGAYEKIVGKVHFAVDPANANNKIIADIDTTEATGLLAARCKLV